MKAREVPGWHYRDDWLYELKKQGARCIAVLDTGTTLYSSSGNDITFKFPELMPSKFKFISTFSLTISTSTYLVMGVSPP
ncbi:hypothetical protein LCGC14_1059760 [marine sediment metagenome]|uniref:Uncharacterized protein n=1 Tax=marine sediment metagenome TaxID=412755 RepID=A0A0F9MR45_9ZZZZ